MGGSTARKIGGAKNTMDGVFFFFLGQSPVKVDDLAKTPYFRINFHIMGAMNSEDSPINECRSGATNHLAVGSIGCRKGKSPEQWLVNG